MYKFIKSFWAGISYDMDRRRIHHKEQKLMNLFEKARFTKSKFENHYGVITFSKK